jgi:hypothetical protein
MGRTGTVADSIQHNRSSEPAIRTAHRYRVGRVLCQKINERKLMREK